MSTVETPNATGDTNIENTDVTQNQENTGTTMTVETTDGDTGEVSVNDSVTSDTATEGAELSVEGAEGEATEVPIDNGVNAISMNENGEFVDSEGNVVDISDMVTTETGTQETFVQKDSMSAPLSGLYVVYALVCFSLIALVLSQKKRSASFGNGMGGGNETYWDKNKGRSMEGKIDLYTKWGIGIFMALTFVITLL